MPMRGSRSGGTSLSEWLRRRRGLDEDRKDGGHEPGAGDGGEDDKAAGRLVIGMKPISP